MLVLTAGQRVRDLRKEMRLTQIALARSVGISAAYLSLIEHDKRNLGADLRDRIAARLNIAPEYLTGADEARLSHDVLEVARSLSLPGLDEVSAARFVAYSRPWADAFKKLYRIYVDANQTSLALSERLSQDPVLRELSHTVLTQITSIRSCAEILEQVSDIAEADRLRFSTIIASQSDSLGSSARQMIALLDTASDTPKPTSPQGEVDDFIIFHGGYFPALEQAADALRRELGDGPITLDAAVLNRLTDRHAINVVSRDRNDSAFSAKDEKTLVIDALAHDTTARFQQTRRLAALEMAALIDDHLKDQRLTSEEARRIAHRALANYAAAAVLYPYRAFHEAAKDYRYDIDRLAARFHGSFEQIARRLVTLRRPGEEGIPFSFLRVDPAGNISKPFSVAGLRMPRMGGACPLWAIYEAFSSPQRTLAQLAVMPHGERYLFIARRRTKHLNAHGRPPVTFSVMLGCDASYSDRLVYGDAFSSRRPSLETPVGFNCRSCPRGACPQRALPSFLEGETAP